jgi:hypothetical protein
MIAGLIGGVLALLAAAVVVAGVWLVRVIRRNRALPPCDGWNSEDEE